MEAEMNRQGLATDEEAEFEAVYALERAVKCPSCTATLRKLNVVRTLRKRCARQTVMSGAITVPDHPGG